MDKIYIGREGEFVPSMEDDKKSTGIVVLDNLLAVQQSHAKLEKALRDTLRTLQIVKWPETPRVNAVLDVACTIINDALQEITR